MSYNFLNAKINNIDSNLTIDGNKGLNFSFYYELDPDSSKNGLFISGQN